MRFLQFISALGLTTLAAAATTSQSTTSHSTTSSSTTSHSTSRTHSTTRSSTTTPSTTTPHTTTSHSTTSHSTTSPTTTIHTTTTHTCAPPPQVTFDVGDELYENYKLYYQGSGYTESPNNPGNDPPNFPSITNQLNSSLSACAAVRECAQLCFHDEGIFYSFDLHFRRSTQLWECVQYFNWNEDAGYFNVTDSDVLVGYGYSI